MFISLYFIVNSTWNKKQCPWNQTILLPNCLSSYMLPLMTNSCSPFSGFKEILSIYASICRFWAIWYIVPSYNIMHVAECHFLAGSIRLWKFFTTLPEGTRLLDFWVHYPTLPLPKLKNHYLSGPVGIHCTSFFSAVKIFNTVKFVKPRNMLWTLFGKHIFTSTYHYHK